MQYAPPQYIGSDYRAAFRLDHRVMVKANEACAWPLALIR